MTNTTATQQRNERIAAALIFEPRVGEDGIMVAQSVAWPPPDDLPLDVWASVMRQSIAALVNDYRASNNPAVPDSLASLQRDAANADTENSDTMQQLGRRYDEEHSQAAANNVLRSAPPLDCVWPWATLSTPTQAYDPVDYWNRVDIPATVSNDPLQVIARAWRDQYQQLPDETRTTTNLVALRYARLLRWYLTQRTTPFRRAVQQSERATRSGGGGLLGGGSGKVLLLVAAAFALGKKKGRGR